MTLPLVRKATERFGGSGSGSSGGGCSSFMAHTCTATVTAILVLLAVGDRTSYLLSTELVQPEQQNGHKCPPTSPFDAHVAAYDAATAPGRGYIPTRHNAMLPDVKGSYWWLNDKVDESFKMAQLDMTYPAEYFKGSHPSGDRDTKAYSDYVFRYAQLFMPERKPVTSLVEFGNGGGYYAKVFSDALPLDSFMTVEGTGAGIAETRSRNVPEHQIRQHDLRHVLYLGRRFDVAVCTEVVEHVEPPFASQIIMTLVLHADVIWFSFKPGGDNHNAWINHPNERPLKMWQNLFDFYGYNIVRIPHKVTVDVVYRGDFLAYRRDNTTLSRVTEQDLEENAKPEHRTSSTQ